MKLEYHHIGIACKDIDVCLAFMKDAMQVKTVSPVVFDDQQDAQVCLVTLETGEQLELISGKVVENLVSKGISYYHTCYVVADIHEAIAFLKTKHNGVVVSPPKPGKLYDNRLAAFVYTPIGIIELLQRS